VYGLYISSDNGTNWNHYLTNINVNAIIVNGTNIFTGTGSGVYISTDYGSNWNQTLSNQIVFSLSLKGNNLFAGTLTHGVYISSNNGSSWTQSSLNNVNVGSIISNNDYVLAGTSSGVYISSDNGLTWNEFNSGFFPVSNIKSLLITSEYIFAGTQYYSVWRRQVTEAGIKKITSNFHDIFSLSQNYPNPFNPATTINYELPPAKDGMFQITNYVKLVVYDVLGKEAAVLVNEKQTAGKYRVTWDGSAYSSGIYFYKLVVDGNIIDTKKMVLIK